LHGVYAVLWTERYHHTALMYLDRNGEQLWDEPLLLVQPTGNDTIRNDSTVFYNPYIIPYDSSVICAWQKVNSNESSPNYAQRVDYGGDKLWNGGDPLLVFPDKWPTYLLPVSNNGAIMSNGQGSIIQLHFINADGQLGQIKTGVKILPPEDTPQNSEHLLPGLFPIPANSQINIKFSEDFQKVNQIVLLDPSGRTVIRLPLPRSSITTIPLYDFPSGAYFLRFNIDANTQYAPLLILK